MGMHPVRRAFVILLVAAAVVRPPAPARAGPGHPEDPSAVGAAEPRHANYLAGLLGAQLTRGNSYTVLTNGDQIFPAMLEAIREARAPHQLRDLHLQEGRDRRTQFTARSKRRPRRGVRVHLVIDAIGGSRIPKSTSSVSDAAGCRLASSTSRSWYSLEELNYRTHRKILVVDGRDRRSPAASASTISGWATRRTRNTGATRWSRSAARSPG